MKKHTITTLVDFLKIQTLEAQNWTKDLVKDISDEKWFTTPETVESNFAWQIGHLTLSQYYYIIVLLSGPQNNFWKEFPTKKYSRLFAKGENKHDLFTEVSIEELLRNLELVHEQSDQVIDGLNDEDLDRPVFAHKPNPFVTTKQESISWNIKHTMMHCGQIAMLRRVLAEPFDYGF